MTNQVIHECPVQPYTVAVLSNVQELKRSLTKLRRSMRHCRDCIAGDQCAILQDFQAQFSTAISEVNAEWDIATQ